MSNKEGLYTDGFETLNTQVQGIQMDDVDAVRRGETSVGKLVSSATAQMSELFRSEVELAKTELAAEAKKGAIGGGLFGAAAVVGGFSLFFFFMFLAFLFSAWLGDREWAGFGIVFLIMIAIAGILALIGLMKVKKVGKPKKTIQSVNDLKQVVPKGKNQKAVENTENLKSVRAGLYS